MDTDRQQEGLTNCLHNASDGTKVQLVLITAGQNNSGVHLNFQFKQCMPLCHEQNIPFYN